VMNRMMGVVVITFCSMTGWSQEFPADSPTHSNGADTSAQTEDKRIFGIIPNFRSSAMLENYEPLTSGEKFKIATDDSFDRGTFALAGLFGGEAMLTNSNKDFGQGAAGFARYYGASFGDFMIGNYMTEAVFPSVLHQDPRYFRRGTGSKWSRLGYAAGQTIWTHRDSDGSRQFNYSEILGNSTAVAISNAYYVDNRTASSAVGRFGIQIGVDMAANIFREFWPDVARKFRHKHQPSNASGSN
jgi:hypothetical protein